MELKLGRDICVKTIIPSRTVQPSGEPRRLFNLIISGAATVKLRDGKITNSTRLSAVLMISEQQFRGTKISLAKTRLSLARV